MSEHQQYLAEKKQIDAFIQKGYQIQGVNEHLNGASVNFLHPNGSVTETILVGTANARKYFSSLLIKQKAESK